MSRITGAAAQPSTPEPTLDAAGPNPPGAAPASATTSPAVKVEPYRLSNAMTEAGTALTRTFSDLIVSDCDVARVHDALEKLPPAQYRQAISELDRKGLLDTYLGEMDGAARERFLQQAVQKGLMKEKGGVPSEARRDPTGKFYNPPAIPKFIVPNTDVPGVVQEAAVKRNGEVVGDYEKAYGQYVERYEKALAQATHPSTLRQMEEPVLPHGFPELRQYVPPREWRALRSYNERYNDLIGRIPSGLVLQSTTSANAKLSENVTLKGEFEATRLPGNKLQTKDTLITEAAVKGVGADTEGDLQVSVGGAEVKLSPNGNLELSHRLPVGIPGIAKTEVGSKVLADVENNTLLGGISAKVEIGPWSLEQDVLVGFRGMQRDVMARVVQDDPMGLFHPPELERGVRWEQLSEARQRELSIRHSEQRWNAAIDARARAQK